MKPSKCSGGTVVTTTGRFSHIHNKVGYKQFGALSDNQKENSLCSIGSGTGARRQEQQQSKNNDAYYLNPTMSSTTTRPSSPFIVYRSAKYVRPHARFFKSLCGYAKYYLVIPAALLANRCRHVFYQLCGFLLLIVASPLWILIVLGLFILRRLRLLLIQRLYPGLISVDDYGSSYTSCETNESFGLNLVNSLVWTRGKLDAHTIRKHFKLLFSENQNVHRLLQMKLVSKFGTTFWETSDNWNIENHIVEAPQKFHNCPIVDEPLKELYRTGSNKSILQKYISYCVSLPLEHTAPPWKIHVISYISRDGGIKEKTCLVIRMHAALIENQDVRKAFRELFINSQDTDKDVDIIRPGDIKNKNLSRISCNSEANGYVMSSCNYSTESDSLSFWKLTELKQFCVGEKIKEISLYHQKAFRVWINLRLKQLEFHSKPFVMSIVLVDIKDTLKRFCANLEIFACDFWRHVCLGFKHVAEKLQALAAIPMIILGSIILRTDFNALGLRRSTNATRRLISWSDLLHADLIEEICRQTGTSSPSNVIMMACSYALKDYYLQNNIPCPGRLGFIVGNPSTDFTSLMSLKCVGIPCNISKYPLKTLQELQCMEDVLAKYPNWKVFGLRYTMRYGSHFMPTCLAQKIHRRIVACYPFLFSHVNMNSAESFLSCHEPVHQVYGEIVDEFLPPVSDFGVSITLVQYSGKTRLFVVSPFQSMDTVLTQRCNQYLIKIAEDVGVEKSKIPYSRRSSPASTSCSTPQYPACILNHSKKSDFKFKEKV